MLRVTTSATGSPSATGAATGDRRRHRLPLRHRAEQQPRARRGHDRHDSDKHHR